MASFSAPTLLATFQTSHASSSKNPHVTLAPVHGSNGEQGVAAVKGDGIWTYDLRTLRPTTSFTVPPSTVFTSPPFSFISPDVPTSSSKGKNKAVPSPEDAEMGSSVDSGDEEESGPQRITMIGVQESYGQRKAKGNPAELWVWKGDDGTKTTLDVVHPVHTFHLSNSPRYPTLAVSTNGQLILLDSGLVTCPLQLQLRGFGVVASRVIPSSNDALGIILLGRDGRICSIRVAIPLEGNPSANITSETRLGKCQGIISADISEDGTVSAIDSSHHLHRLSVRQASSSTNPSPPLTSDSTSAALASIPSPQPTILHAVSQPVPSLLLTLVDSAKPIVVADADISGLTTGGKITQITLLGKAAVNSVWTVAFVVWHKHSEGDAGRSVIYTCEVTLPAKGFGMNLLLGLEERTNRYLTGSVATQTFIPNGKSELADLPNGDSKVTVDITNLPENKLSPKLWRAVSRALRDNATLQSSILVAVLKRAIVEEHLELIYTTLLALPPPAIDFRLAFRRNITADEATQLLSQLVKWSQAWCERRTEGLGWPEVERPDNSAASPLPSLESILAHASLLLDSHLPILVEHDPASALLESLSTSLTPLLALQTEIRLLRAPIDALLTLSKREEKRRAQVKAKREAMRTMIVTQTAASGKKGLQGYGEGKSGGGMTLPGEEFGDWRVEDYTF